MGGVMGLGRNGVEIVRVWGDFVRGGGFLGGG